MQILYTNAIGKIASVTVNSFLDIPNYLLGGVLKKNGYEEDYHPFYQPVLTSELQKMPLEHGSDNDKQLQLLENNRYYRTLNSDSRATTKFFKLNISDQELFKRAIRFLLTHPDVISIKNNNVDY